MTYDLLRFGEAHEQHLVLKHDPESCGVRYGRIIVEGEEIDFEELTEYPSLSLNDLQASTGTAAEEHYVFGVPKPVGDHLEFSSPFGLPTLKDALTLARLQRALRAMDEQSILGIERGTVDYFIRHPNPVDHLARLDFDRVLNIIGNDLKSGDEARNTRATAILDNLEHSQSVWEDPNLYLRLQLFKEGSGLA